MDDYFVIIHPSAERDLVEMLAREKWREAFRWARVFGDKTQSPRQIMAAWRPATMRGEIVKLQGVTFHV